MWYVCIYSVWVVSVYSVYLECVVMYVGVGMHVVYVGVCAMHTHIAR